MGETEATARERLLNSSFAAQVGGPLVVDLNVADEIVEELLASRSADERELLEAARQIIKYDELFPEVLTGRDIPSNLSKRVERLRLAVEKIGKEK